MTVLTREAGVKLLTIAVAVLTLLQLYVPQMPLINKETAILVSAIFMYLATAFTAWKQYLSCDISTKKALHSTLLIAIIATIGGLNELVNNFGERFIQINSILGQWIRFSLTAIVAMLNFLSKEIFPSQELIIKRKEKED